MNKATAVMVMCASLAPMVFASHAEASVWGKIKRAAGKVKDVTETVVDKTTSVATYPVRKLVAEPVGKVVAAAAGPVVKKVSDGANRSSDHAGEVAKQVVDRAGDRADRALAAGGQRLDRSADRLESMEQRFSNGMERNVIIASGAFVTGCTILGACMVFRRK